MDIERLRSNVLEVEERIAIASRRSGRDRNGVRLVAVTKRNPIEMVRPLVELGIRDLGENYPQELWTKAEALRDLAIRWHLIGHLQGNKAKPTLPVVRIIHAVDSLKLLRSLDALCSGLPDPPAVCLQVNTSGEVSKHGWSPDAVLEDADDIAACRSIPVVGLMTMAALGTDAEQARPAFVRLRTVRDALRDRTGLPLNELSMGMSNDFETAIEEGATWVRVGSALFEGMAR
jgi:PLP dependent protein